MRNLPKIFLRSFENVATNSYLTSRGKAMRCDMRSSRIIRQNNTKTKNFCWWKVLDDGRRMGQWSFWSWFDPRWGKVR